MMEQKIEIPAGYEIDSFDKEKGIVKFKKINPMDKFKDFDKVFEFNNVDKDRFRFYSSLFDSREASWLRLNLLSKALNSVVENKDKKYFVYKDKYKGHLMFPLRIYDLGERIIYDSKEAAEFALKHYSHLYDNLR